MNIYLYICITLCACLTCILLYGGSTSSNDFPKNFGLVERNHPLDLLVKKHISALSDNKFTYVVSDIAGFTTASFLDCYCFYAFSKEKQTLLENMSSDISSVLQKLVIEYNNIPQIRPYTVIFPASADAINLWLAYGTSRKERYKPPYYCMAGHETYGDICEFFISDEPQRIGAGSRPTSVIPINQITSLKPFENYGVPRQKNQIPKMIETAKDFENCHELEAKYTYSIMKKMCRTYDLQIAALRHAAYGKWSYRTLSAGFWSTHYQMKLEEASQFAITFLEEYLGKIRAEKAMEKKYHNNPNELQRIQENLNWFCFRITFWDEYINRVEEPYIAMIQCQDGKIMYFTADEGQRLQLVKEEPIPEKFFPMQVN